MINPGLFNPGLLKPGMFKKDLCLELLHASANSEITANHEMLSTLVEAVSLSAETPLERMIQAVKDELTDINSCAQAEVLSLQSSVLQQKALEILKGAPCRFPREELINLVAGEALLGESSLKDVLEKHIARHKDLERRLSWLLKPLTSEETAKLDPMIHCDEIYHSISYEFRSEMKIFSILYEVRAVIVASANSFLLTTGEFAERSVKRLVDTVLLVANILEWGLDSYRGRTCIERINEIHSRYTIPNELFKFILCGILFGPEDWNEKYGWRPFTENEKLGWYHAIAKVGRAMNVQEISDDPAPLKAWYEEYCRKHSRYGEVKRRLFDQIVSQVLASYPEKTRPLLLSAILCGMDDVYRTATGYPEPPAQVQQAAKAVFMTLGHLGSALPRIPWFRTLQSNLVYPYGYKVEELGVSARSPHFPSISESLPSIPLEEVEKHQTEEDLWMVIHEDVYDMTQFVKNHPGGRDVLIRYAGKDATEAFSKVPHSEAAKVMMLNYRIGRLASAKEKKSPSGCPFAGLSSSFKSTEEMEVSFGKA